MAEQTFGVSKIVERLVPDELWELFQQVVPDAPSRPQGGGRRRHGDRESAGCDRLRGDLGLHVAAGADRVVRAVRRDGPHRRFTGWTKVRLWAKLHRLVLDELGSRGELDWSRCAIDSVNMRALERGN